MAEIVLAVSGAAGRMGTEVCLGAKEKGFSVQCLVDGHLQPQEGVVTARAPEEVPKDLKLEVWIDFSSPDLCLASANFCASEGIAFVSGTTGLDASVLQMAAEKIPLLWAPNMSLGVAFLTHIVEQVNALNEFDFQIEEIHHRYKKDRPSGTAIQLQKTLDGALGRENPEPLVIRGGGAIGTHRLWAFGEDEVLVFEHQACHRRLFANGALEAARWLVGKKPGFYRMKDVIQGKE